MLRACRVLLLLGLCASAVGMSQTLAFTWDSAFEAPDLPEGRRHPNYHAFREFTLSVGAAAVLLWGMFQPVANRRRELWVAMLLAALGYYAGWWLPGPLFGLQTPNAAATLVHTLATVLTLAAVALAWRHFPRGGLGPATQAEETQ